MTVNFSNPGTYNVYNIVYALVHYACPNEG